MKFSFSIPGKPVPKARPRIGRGGHVYTPSQPAEKALGREILVAMAQCGCKRISGPIWAKLTFCGASPLADLDNLLKHFMDAANGVLWNDDRQVVEIHARKIKGGEAYTSIEVEEILYE